MKFGKKYDDYIGGGKDLWAKQMTEDILWDRGHNKTCANFNVEWNASAHRVLISILQMGWFRALIMI